MKKLNRKGFTLVELLAVIVILAIVVGITLVTVLPTLKSGILFFICSCSIDFMISIRYPPFLFIY